MMRSLRNAGVSDAGAVRGVGGMTDRHEEIMGTNRSSHTRRRTRSTSSAFARIASACILAALLPVASAGAQAFELAVGPALRQFDLPPFHGGSAAWDAMAVRATWSGRISPRARLVLGAGALGGPSIVEEFAVPSFAPCLPQSQCPPPIRRTVLSGSLVHAQLGLGFEEGWFALSGGALIAHSTRGDERTGVGSYADLRLRPFARARAVSIGVFASRVSPSPGGQRGVVMPSLGIRF